jgi:serine O-acetyltransferase
MSQEPPGLLAQVRGDFEAHGRGFMHPGFHALAVHRLGAWRRTLTGPARFLASLIYRPLFIFVRNAYGIELPDTTEIGSRVQIGHHNGIVIHPQAKIGDGCAIRQNCLIGSGTGAPGRYDDRAPVVGNDVLIGANVAIFGAITIGDGARIGPGAVITRSVSPGAVVVAPAPRVLGVGGDTR